jgi:Protein of unknown function (DUF3306)
VSEPESFLARWTRLKREAEEAARAAATQEPAQHAEGTPSQPSSAIAGAEPTLDLSALPPIEEITATTDIRAYLAPGVPAELSRAALRRAWLADPTIRDFIGIAENQWDFNDPHGIPGFGPLEDAGRLLAQLLGGEQERDAALPTAPAPDAPQDMASLPDVPATLDESHPAAVEQPEPASPPGASMSTGGSIAAPQQIDLAQPPRPALRGHGGALPK